MDELNLDQLRELIGNLETSESTYFSLDDIMKEVEEAQNELNAAPTETGEPEPRSAEEPDEAEPEDDAAPEPASETQPEEPLLADRPKKKHFWDGWIVPEETAEAEAEPSIAEEFEAEEDEPERIGFFASLFEGAKGDAEIAEDEGDEEPEDVFQEKQPKRRFWDRWLTPEKLEEDAFSEPPEPQSTEAEETIAIPVEDPQDEPEPMSDPQPTVVFAPVAEEPDEETERMEQPDETEQLFTSISRAAETGAPELEFDAQPIAALMEELAEEAEEEEIETIEPIEEEAAAEEPSEREEALEEIAPEPILDEPEEAPTIPFKKPRFLNKWFAPIEAAAEQPVEPEIESEQEENAAPTDELPEKPDEEASWEETLLQSVPEEQPESNETSAEKPVSAEPDQTISQAEFEAFLREADEQPQPHASFAELMRESGVEWREDAIQTEAPVISENMASQVVYLDLSEQKPETPAEEVPESESEPSVAESEEAAHESEYIAESPSARTRPTPEWMYLPLERLGEIAPTVERVNGEPVLMSEIRRLEREKEQRKQRRNVQAAQPAATVPPMPRPVYPAESGTEDDGGDDEVSGGRRHDRITRVPRMSEKERTERLADGVVEPVSDEERESSDEAIESDAEFVRNKQTRKKKSAFARWRERRRRAQEEHARVPKSAKAGLKQWNRIARSGGRRSVVVGLLTVLAIYLSCSATMKLPVPNALSYSASSRSFYVVLIGLAVLSMLFAWDVLTDGIKALFRLQADFCTLIALTLLLSIVHSGFRMATTGEELTYPCVAMAALFALMRARVAQASARRNTYKTAALNPAPIGVYLHREPKPHLLKRRMEDNDAFVACAAKDGWYSRLERLYTPLAIVAALVMAWVISTLTGDHGRFVYAFSALLVAASQIGLLTAVAFGSYSATQRLLRDDAALAGLTSAVRMAEVSQVVMTEEDLFPRGAILVDDYVDIRGAMELDDVLAYAAAAEGDSALGRVLKEKLHQRYGDQVAAHDRVRYKNGGNGVRIGDREVLFGTAAFLEDMKILVPALPDQGEHLFLAVDGVTEAIFEIEYVATTQVYTALQSLAERHISVLFEAEECYLSAERLCDLFGLQPGMIHMPELEQARAIRSPDYVENDSLLAILTRDGAAPYSDCVDAAYALSRLTAGGLLLGTIAAVLDFVLMTYLCFVFAPLGASPLRVLMYSVLWFIPIFFIENEAKRG